MLHTVASVFFDFNSDVPQHAAYFASYDVCYYTNTTILQARIYLSHMLCNIFLRVYHDVLYYLYESRNVMEVLLCCMMNT